MPSGLAKPWHGMPVWAWALGGGAVLLGGYRVYKARKTAAQAPGTTLQVQGPSTPYDPGGGFSGGSGAGSSGGGWGTGNGKGWPFPWAGGQPMVPPPTLPAEPTPIVTLPSKVHPIGPEENVPTPFSPNPPPVSWVPTTQQATILSQQQQPQNQPDVNPLVSPVAVQPLAPNQQLGAPTGTGQRFTAPGGFAFTYG